MNLFVWVALLIVCTICCAAIWIALHTPRRRWPRSSDVEPAAVTRCKLCGPTAAAIEPSGFCWRCDPHVTAARFHYGNQERA